MISKYKHIIWDWNGTLLDDVNLCVDIINLILTSKNLNKISQEQYRDIFTFPVRDYYIKAGLDLEVHSFETLGSEWMQEYEKNKSSAVLFKGVRNILGKIHHKGISQSILSAYPHDTLVEIVTLHGINEFFSFITGLDHIYATSKIEIGKELIKKIGLNKNEIVMIGDTIHDYEVAHEIGAESILICNGHQSRERLLSCGVPVLNSIDELINFLDEPGTTF